MEASAKKIVKSGQENIIALMKQADPLSKE